MMRDEDKTKKHLINESNDIVFLTDMEGRIQRCSKAMAAFLKKSYDEIIGGMCWDVMHGKSEPIKECPLMRMRRSRCKESVVLQVNGRWLNGSVYPLLDEDGNLTGSINIISDITEHKWAEEALRESEEKYRILVENANEIILVAQDGVLKFANPKAMEFTGYSKDELTSRPFIEFIHPDDRDMVAERHAIRLKGGLVPYTYAFRMIDKDENIKWMELSTAMIIWDGRPATLNFLNDVTKRKQAEEALRESEGKYRLIFENAREGISIYEELPDGSRKLIDCNPQYVEMSGYSREELMQIGDTRKFQDDHRTPEEEAAGIEKILAGQPFSGIFSWRRPDGEENDIEYTAAPINMDGRRFTIGIDHDITKRKQSEKQLKASLIEKEVILKEIHHRVKNNLQVISSLLNMSCMQTENKEAIALLVDARTRVFSMALIHSQLYQTEQLDRIDMGVHVRSLFAHLANVYATGSRFITPIIENSGVFLPVTQAIPCSLALGEVISSIFKHAFKEGQRGTVEVSMQGSTNDTVYIRVKDDGVGIPEETDMHKAHNIGISFIRTLVQDQLEGKIQINRGNGTEFVIEFPNTQSRAGFG